LGRSIDITVQGLKGSAAQGRNGGVSFKPLCLNYTGLAAFALTLAAFAVLKAFSINSRIM